MQKRLVQTLAKAESDNSGGLYSLDLQPSNVIPSPDLTMVPGLFLYPGTIEEYRRMCSTTSMPGTMRSYPPVLIERDGVLIAEQPGNSSFRASSEVRSRWAGQADNDLPSFLGLNLRASRGSTQRGT